MINASKTYAGDCLHRKLSPLTPDQTEKKTAEKVEVVVEELMRIVEDNPCQSISSFGRGGGGRRVFLLLGRSEVNTIIFGNLNPL